ERRVGVLAGELKGRRLARDGAVILDVGRRAAEPPSRRAAEHDGHRWSTCPPSIELWKLHSAPCPPRIAIQPLRIASLAIRLSSPGLSGGSRMPPSAFKKQIAKV